MNGCEARLTSGPLTMQSPEDPDRQEGRGRGEEQWTREEVTTGGTHGANVARKR